MISIKATIAAVPYIRGGQELEIGSMRLFLIEAYGGPTPTDGKIEHFTVRAATLDDAIGLLKRSPDSAHYRHFELVEDSPEFPGDDPAIIEAGDAAYL